VLRLPGAGWRWDHQHQKRICYGFVLVDISGTYKSLAQTQQDQCQNFHPVIEIEVGGLGRVHPRTVPVSAAGSGVHHQPGVT